MDGAIPAFSADSRQRLTARFGLSSSTSSALSLQSGLFEQLLSAPAPLRSERQSSSFSASDASSSTDLSAARTRDSEDLSAARRSERDDRRDDPPEDEEQSDSSAVAAQFTPLNTPLVVTPTPTEEDAAVVVSGGAAGGESQGSDSSDENSDHSAVGESPAEWSGSSSDQVNRLPQDAVEHRTAEPASPVADDQVRAVDPDVASGSSVHAANAESVTQAQAAQPVALPVTESAATDAVDAAVSADATALGSTSIAAMEEQSGLERGDERLTHQASGEEHAAAESSERGEAGGQAETASTADGKSRDSRREKWFQRDVGDAHSARRESNVAGSAPATQAAMAAEKLSGAGASAQSAALVGSMGDAAVSGSAAAENMPAQMLPDSLPQVQPTPVSAAATVVDQRLSALESATSDGSGGERQSSRGNAGEAVDTSQRQSNAQRSDAKPGVPDAQRPDVLTQAERVRLVQRVSRSFARLGPMGGQISLKLHPPQLGALNVQVRMEGRSMTAKLTTESGAARDAIMESLPVLRKRLAEQGFEISSFQVEVADSHSEVNSGSDNSHAGSDQASGRDNRQAAGQGTDYRRLAAQQLQYSQGYEVLPSSVASRGAAWELPRGVDVEA